MVPLLVPQNYLKKRKRNSEACAQWPMPVITVTWEVEIWRIKV
jgi:hypothetical protein